MKNLLTCLLLFCLTQSIAQQDAPCIFVIDTLGILKRVHAQKFYHETDKRSFNFYTDTTQHVWVVETFKTRYIHYGDCKRMNGCTEITTVKIILEPGLKKIRVRSKTKDTKLYPHYE